ncbi:MAG: Trk system potassium transporter TrkA [Desulfatiglans sp.]|nr:Trk system potassium transporter TrkA [Desulfatiglans sp.]
MKIIIVGAGEVGFHCAQKLSEEGQDVVLIDKDPAKIKQLTDNLDVQAVIGSGTSPGTLKTAGIVDADMLVAATDSDEANLIACLLARNLNRYILKVARVRNREYLDEKELFGEELLGVDQIINPETAMVETIMNLMTVPGASDVINFVDGKVKLIGFTIRKDSHLAGRQLSTLSNSYGNLLIGAIIRDEKVLIPQGKDTIQTGDLLYMVIKADEISRAYNFLGIVDKEVKDIMITGGGETGLALGKSLEGTRLHTKIIEKDSPRCTFLSEQLEKAVIICGDGTDKDLLFEENIGEMDFLMALTGDEENNVLMSLLAREMGVKKIITRISKLSYIPLVSAIGIDTVVSPRLSAVRAILQYIRKGKVISVAPLKGEHAEAIEVEALETSDIVDRPISQIKFPKGALVGAVIRGGEVIIPTGSTVIQSNDRLIFFALKEVVPKLEKLLTVKLDYF